MEFNLSLLQITALVIAIVGAVIDVRTTKIPNVLTFPATALGLIVNTVMGAMAGGTNGALLRFGDVFLGALIGAVLPVILSGGAKKKIGFGDAKMLMAMGAWLGWVASLLNFFWFAVVWGMVAAYRFFSVFPWRTIVGAFLARSAGGSWFTAEDAARIQKQMRTPIALGPYLAIGVLLSAVLGHATLWFMGLAE